MLLIMHITHTFSAWFKVAVIEFKIETCPRKSEKPDNCGTRRIRIIPGTTPEVCPKDDKQRPKTVIQAGRGWPA
jgi:hypothetical protein